MDMSRLLKSILKAWPYSSLYSYIISRVLCVCVCVFFGFFLFVVFAFFVRFVIVRFFVPHSSFFFFEVVRRKVVLANKKKLLSQSQLRLRVYEYILPRPAHHDLSGTIT